IRGLLAVRANPLRMRSHRSRSISCASGPASPASASVPASGSMRSGRLAAGSRRPGPADCLMRGPGTPPGGDEAAALSGAEDGSLATALVSATAGLLGVAAAGPATTASPPAPAMSIALSPASARAAISALEVFCSAWPTAPAATPNGSGSSSDGPASAAGPGTETVAAMAASCRGCSAQPDSTPSNNAPAPTIVMNFLFAVCFFTMILLCARLHYQGRVGAGRRQVLACQLSFQPRNVS